MVAVVTARRRRTRVNKLLHRRTQNYRFCSEAVAALFPLRICRHPHARRVMLLTKEELELYYLREELEPAYY